jgi:hypothetical protein
MNSEDHASTVRAMIEHENDQQNYRLTWMLAIEGLLFAGIGFAWDKTDAHVLVTVFCVLGAVVSISSWTALRLSKQAMNSIREWWDSHRPKDYGGPDIVGYRANDHWFLWILRPWRFLPWIFVLAWVAILAANLART